MDICITCEPLNVKIKSFSLLDNVKMIYAAELMVHKRRVKNSIFQQFFKERQDNMVIIFDFM